jgi:hypothetical protein
VRDDHPALGDLRGDLRQGFRDIFVGQPVKSVAPHAFGVKLMRDRIVVSDRVMRAVKCGVETGHLRKSWKIGQKRADWRKVMGLMERGKRNEAFQPGYDAMVDQHRPIIVRATMNDAMTDSHRADAKLVPQPFARDIHRGRNVGDRFDRIDAVGQRIAVRTARPQARPATDTIHLPLDLAP